MPSLALLHISLYAAVAAAAPSSSNSSVDQAQPRGPQRAMKVGGGLMAGGGVLMVVGAGVLVPLGVMGAVSARPPDPTTYTAIEPFRDDLIAYQRSVQRSMTFGVAGAITGVVGAVTFAAGALTWGLGRRRSRRTTLSLNVAPARTGLHASVVGRF